MLSKKYARNYMLGHLLLHKNTLHGSDGAVEMLNRLRTVQIDPLSPFGTNVDLILSARVDGCHKGDFFQVVNGRGFEHWAKERCFITEDWFPNYFEHARITKKVQNSWWKHESRVNMILPEVLESVYEEIKKVGPVSLHELTQRGSLDSSKKSWNGAYLTKKPTITNTAVDVLWIQCRIVICGRKANGDKLYDIPERAFPKDIAKQLIAPSSPADIITDSESKTKTKKKKTEKSNVSSKEERTEEISPKLKKRSKSTSESSDNEVKDLKQEVSDTEESSSKSKKRKRSFSPDSTSKQSTTKKLEHEEFYRWAIVERVKAAGFLTRNAGPQWSVIADARRSSIVDDLISEGIIEEVTIKGCTGKFLALSGFRNEVFPEMDDRMRIIGPLDPLLWDRKLIKGIFSFEYIWEVYKPAEKRRWGWYVCPLLHRGKLVGRLEGKIDGDILKIGNIWKESGRTIDEDALIEMLERHVEFCNLSSSEYPPPEDWIEEPSISSSKKTSNKKNTKKVKTKRSKSESDDDSS